MLGFGLHGAWNWGAEVGSFGINHPMVTRKEGFSRREEGGECVLGSLTKD